MKDYQVFAHEVIGRHLMEFGRRARAIPASRDTEDVHQLRVSYRRLNNAIKVFKDIVPPAMFKKWKKKAEPLLAISSQARDLDVQIIFLQNYQRRMRNPRQQAALGELIGRREKRRAKLQPRLAAAIQPLVFDKVDDKKIFYGLIGKKGHVESRHRASSAEMGQKKISKRVKKLRAFLPVVSHPDAHEQHHQMRIAAKHLRYTLEDFAPFYGLEANRLAGRVKEMQDILGDMHDAGVRINDFLTMKRHVPAEQPMGAMIDAVVDSCQRMRTRSYKKFVRVWEQAEKDAIWAKMKELVSVGVVVSEKKK